MLATGLALAVGAPLVATTADAAVVICQRKNKLKLRVDACKSKETQVPAADLGVVGPAGADGAPGANGTAIGYAHVLGDGTVDTDNSFNVTQANVTAGLTSAFCFHDLPFTVKSVGITIDYNPGGFGPLPVTAQATLGDPFGECALLGVTSQVEVATDAGGAFAPFGFFIVFN
jgi:hypothetical protein